MSEIRKFLTSTATVMGDRQVRVRCSSGSVDRAGDIVVQTGIKFAASIPVLWSHDPEKPVGRASPQLTGGELYAVIDFAPAGVSKHADEICGLTKAGVITGVSIGFDPLERSPIDPKNPYAGGQKYTKVELLELSIVSVPCNEDAEVVGRSHKSGRVISAANREKLQAAHDAAETCRSIVADVIGTGEDVPTDLGVDINSDKARRRRQAEAFALKHGPDIDLAPRILSKVQRQAEAQSLGDLAYGSDPVLRPVFKLAAELGMHMTEERARTLVAEAQRYRQPVAQRVRFVFSRAG